MADTCVDEGDKDVLLMSLTGLVSQYSQEDVVVQGRAVGLRDTHTYDACQTSFVPGRKIGRCRRIAGSFSIRSASATPFISPALKSQDGSNSSSLTSTNVWVLISPQPEKRKVSLVRSADSTCSVPHAPYLCSVPPYLRTSVPRVVRISFTEIKPISGWLPAREKSGLSATRQRCAPGPRR
jgi:hypothetical protein